MNAIILAAGEGKRLKPLTDNMPKCMIDLFGKPILERQLEIFRICGINDISIVTGYHYDKITSQNIHYFRNKRYATTNMVETLFCAKEKLLDSTIISYGDIIFEKQVLQKLIDDNNDIAVVVDKNWKKYWNMRFNNSLDDAESLKLDSNGFITNIGQKTTNLMDIQAQYIGLMKFQNNGIKDLINFYDAANLKSQSDRNILNSRIPFEKLYMTDLLQAMIHAGYRIKSVTIEGGWLELDSINDYKLYKKKQKNKTISELITLENNL